MKDEDFYFALVALLVSVVWFIFHLVKLIQAIKNGKDKEKITEQWGWLLCTPVAILPAALLAFFLFMIFLMDTIPEKLSKLTKKNEGNENNGI